MDTIIFSEPLPLSVPNVPLEVHVKNGDYGHVDLTVITEKNFPIKDAKGREIQISLARINPEIGKRIATKELMSAFAQAGFRSAWSEEFFSLGTQYPKLQQQFMIVLLDNPLVPPVGADRHLVLTFNNNRRAILLTTVPDWNSEYRFPVVRVSDTGSGGRIDDYPDFLSC